MALLTDCVAGQHTCWSAPACTADPSTASRGTRNTSGFSPSFCRKDHNSRAWCTHVGPAPAVPPRPAYHPASALPELRHGSGTCSILLQYTSAQAAHEQYTMRMHAPRGAAALHAGRNQKQAAQLLQRCGVRTSRQLAPANSIGIRQPIPQPAVSPRYSNSLGAMDGLSSVLALRTKGAEVGEARHSDPVL